MCVSANGFQDPGRLDPQGFSPTALRNRLEQGSSDSVKWRPELIVDRGSLFNSQWHEFNRILRMSVIFGLVGGRLVASFGLLAIGYNLTVGSKLSGISAYSFLDFLFLLLFLFPILSLICSLWLVFFPVSSERRGTLASYL